MGVDWLCRWKDLVRRGRFRSTGRVDARAIDAPSATPIFFLKKMDPRSAVLQLPPLEDEPLQGGRDAGALDLDHLLDVEDRVRRRDLCFFLFWHPWSHARPYVPRHRWKALVETVSNILVIIPYWSL